MKPIETAITRIFATDGSIVGLGFLIAESRIMTCAHVVADAVGIERDDPQPPSHTISVDFPLVDDNKRCTASLVVWLPSRDGTDDIAVLELHEAAPASAIPADLVIVDNLWGAELGVYGFPRYNPKGVWAKGRVSGSVEGKRIQIDALEGNTSYFIEPGFSGSPVYSNDPNINGVIGMAVSAESDPNIKAGFMIPSEVLFTKMNQRQPLPQLTDDGQTSPLRTPINMTDGKPQPVSSYTREGRPRVVYIGEFAEIKPAKRSKTVFIAHSFFGGDSAQMQDYRIFLKEGLTQVGYQPVFSGNASGTLLKTICKEIIDTEAGIFDVSGYNANVLIELGMSIGLNQPTIVIAQDDRKPLIDPLQQLNPLRYADRYDLAEGIGQAVKEHIQKYHQSGMSPRFCAACGLDCIARKPRQSPEDEYLLVGADPDKDRAIFFHLKKAVKNFNLSWHELEGDFNLTVCQWVEEIKRSKLVFFHSKENGDKRHSGSDNASTMVRTGIAIGLGIAWRMILKQGERMPTDLEGYKYVTWQSSATAFDATLGGAVRTLLSEARPYGGMYGPLIPVEAVEDEEQSLTLVDSPQQILSSVFIGYASGDGVGKKLAQDIQAVANTLQIETFISLNHKETIDRYGDNWRETIIPDLDVAMFTISDNSPNSRSIALELKIALSSNIPTYFIMGPDTPIDLLQRLSDSDNDLNKIPVVRLEANEEQAIEEQIKSSLLSILSDQPKSFPTLAEVVRTATSQNNYVYISASRKDTEFIEQLLSDLTKNHISVWVDKNIPGGTEWQNTIERGIRDCAVAIIVISESLSKSKFVQEEINLLLDLSKPIIPILIGSPRDIPRQLLTLHYADFTSDYNYGLPRLIEGIRRYLPNQGAKSPVRAENKHIFIAYVRRDTSDFSRRLSQNLREAGFTSFTDVDSIPLGQRFEERIYEEVERSDIVLCIMSSNALRSEWWIKEIAWAFEMNKLVIPILLDGETMPRPSSLPSEIQQLSYLGAVAFRSQEFERDFQHLVAQLAKIQLSSPTVDRSLVLDRHANQLISAIQPTSNETEYVYEEVNKLKSKLQDVFARVQELENMLRDIVLFGSISRKTAVSPIWDVDILILLRINPKKQDPKMAFEVMQTALENIYGNKINRRSPSFSSSISVKLPNAWLEISPAAVDEQMRIVTPNQIRREWQWVQTNHLIHERYTQRQNEASDGAYTKIILMFKWWQNIHAKKGQRYLSGFVLECLVAQLFDAQNTQNNLLDEFAQVLQRMLHLLKESRDLRYVSELGVPGNRKSTGLNGRKLNEFTDFVEQTSELIEKARLTENIEEELLIWREIFGDRFPTRL